MKAQAQVQGKNKTFSLSDEETQNIESRQNLIKQYQYLIHVINSDIVAYMKIAVYERCGLEKNVDYILAQDNKSFTLKEENESNTNKAG